MPDIATHTKIIATVAPSAAAAVGQTLGLDLWPLIFSASGGGMMLIWIDPPLAWWRAVLSVAASTALGGFIGQIMAYPLLLTLLYFFPFLKPWEPQALPGMVATVALIVGVFTQSVMPNLLKRSGERASNV